ncbi:hypothetical protein HGRIS_009603 [Hohenbuehelia grisea]|uniref:RRM domain-containing protein n=1 Tax=Hohenbuehelia grisea TaxID=104357 RepID=A0ABR3J1T6_9AGAR
MSNRGRSTSPRPLRDVEVSVENSSSVDKPNAKVVIVTNLTRSVVESHLQTIFSFYGQINKIDLPLFAKSGQNRGKAAIEYTDAPAAHKAASHMNGGQLDGAVLKVELSDLPVRSRSRSFARNARNGRDNQRSLSRSRSRSRSPIGGPYRRREPLPPPRDSFRGRPYGRRGPPPRDFRRQTTDFHQEDAPPATHVGDLLVGARGQGATLCAPADRERGH